MKLIIARHGRAGTASNTSGDGERRLTAEGREDVRRVARRLRELGERPGAILSSPLARALETAEIFSVELNAPPPIPEPGLSSGTTAEAIIAVIEQRFAVPSLMLVGHNPEFGVLAACLCGGGARFDLAAGQAACMSIASQGGALKAEMLYSVSP